MPPSVRLDVQLRYPAPSLAHSFLRQECFWKPCVVEQEPEGQEGVALAKFVEHHLYFFRIREEKEPGESEGEEEQQN